MKTPTQIRQKAIELYGESTTIEELAFIAGAEWMQQESSAEFTKQQMLDCFKAGMEYGDHNCESGGKYGEYETYIESFNEHIKNITSTPTEAKTEEVNHDLHKFISRNHKYSTPTPTSKEDGAEDAVIILKKYIDNWGQLASQLQTALLKAMTEYATTKEAGRTKSE